MGAPKRIRGQEVKLTIVTNGVQEAEITEIKNFNLEFEGEIKSEGFLGEMTNRKDDIFNGVKFDFEIESHSPDWLVFFKTIIARQKRQNPGTVINISCQLTYASGQTPTIFLPDVKFGPSAMNIGSRADYVGKKIAGECDDFDTQGV